MFQEVAHFSRCRTGAAGEHDQATDKKTVFLRQTIGSDDSYGLRGRRRHSGQRRLPFMGSIVPAAAGARMYLLAKS